MTGAALPPADEVKRIRVVGAGVMGAGIAELAARNGVLVELADVDPAAAPAAIERLRLRFERDMREGRESGGMAETVLARIDPIADPTKPGDVDLIIEAVKEELAVKQDLFRSLEQVCPRPTVLATNTSSFPITAIGSALRDPTRLVGLHFFNPVTRMRVAEVIPGVRTQRSIVAAMTAFVRRLGHEPVIARDSPGFIVNHVGRGLLTEALQVLDEGIAAADDVDSIARDVLGLRMGPFELLDLTGLDVSHPVMESIWSGFYGEPRLRPSPTTRLRAQAGLFGRKTGEGFYLYAEGVKQVQPAKHHQTYDGTPVWTANTVLAQALQMSGVVIDSGATPAGSSIALVTPLGSSAANAGHASGLPLNRVLGVDPLGDFRTRLTLAVHPGCDPDIGRSALGALAATGRPVTVVRDAPASVAQRLLASIINTAAEIAYRRIASPVDIDTASRLGLGYPRGPLAWGDSLGPLVLLGILQSQEKDTGDPRYRPSRWLTERALLGLPLQSGGTDPDELFSLEQSYTQGVARA